MNMKISVTCCNCDEEIIHNVWCQDGVVPLDIFSCTSFECEKCDHVTVIGDIETFDSEDL
jgi:hypothetical protein